MRKSRFSERDEGFMSLALHEAEQALGAGDYPVGAVLTVNGKLLGKARNSIFTEDQTIAHAEKKVLSSYSTQLRQLTRDDNMLETCLYTTLEPCLMCLGIAVLHRVKRIVFACPDPHGGARKVNPIDLGCFYAEHWPNIEEGLMKERACDLILRFLPTGKFVAWEVMLKEFSAMRERW